MERFHKVGNVMNSIKKNISGILACLAIALPSWYLGKLFPIIGGAVIAILAGMIITMFWTNKGNAEYGIKFTSKKILQAAVVLLGFGLNLNVILETGKQSSSSSTSHLLSPCNVQRALGLWV